MNSHITSPNNTRTKPRALCLTVLTCALLLSCTQTPEQQPADAADVRGDTVRLTRDQRSHADLVFASAVRAERTTALRVTGMVHVPPQYAYSITSPYGGTVSNLAILPGSSVRKGQTLLSLENPEFIRLQNEYLSTGAQLEAAELEFTRQSRLASDSINARKRLEAATSQVQTLRAAHKALAEQLALVHINARTLTVGAMSRSVKVPAPISGYVTTVRVNNGAFVSPNTAMLELVDPSHMHIELSVYERDIQKLRVDQSVLVSLTDAPQVQREAYIHLIGRDVRADRTVAVHAHLRKPDPTIVPGTTLTAVVQSEPRMSWVVPEHAVVNYDGKAWVFTGTPQACIRREVQIGTTEQGTVEIISNPAWIATEKILVQGASTVLGAMVQRGE